MTNLNQIQVSETYQQKLPMPLQRFLPPEIAHLIDDSLQLINIHSNLDSQEKINDYAFTIFPLAKAYEGFLKFYFFQIGALKKDVYNDKNFRIGRSFNPDLPMKLRDEVWIYDEVAQVCGDELARNMWQAWLDARNHLFHFFPGKKYELTLNQAEKLFDEVIEAMNQAVICHPQF